VELARTARRRGLELLRLAREIEGLESDGDGDGLNARLIAERVQLASRGRDLVGELRKELDTISELMNRR
jgi:hypothetical protein